MLINKDDKNSRVIFDNATRETYGEATALDALIASLILNNYFFFKNRFSALTKILFDVIIFPSSNEQKEDYFRDTCFEYSSEFLTSTKTFNDFTVDSQMIYDSILENIETLDSKNYSTLEVERVKNDLSFIFSHLYSYSRILNPETNYTNAKDINTDPLSKNLLNVIQYIKGEYYQPISLTCFLDQKDKKSYFYFSNLQSIIEYFKLLQEFSQNNQHLYSLTNDIDTIVNYLEKVYSENYKKAQKKGGFFFGLFS